MDFFTFCIGIFFLFLANKISKKAKEEQDSSKHGFPLILIILGIISIVGSFFINNTSNYI